MAQSGRQQNGRQKSGCRFLNSIETVWGSVTKLYQRAIISSFIFLRKTGDLIFDKKVSWVQGPSGTRPVNPWINNKVFYLEYKPRWYLPPDSVVTSTSREKYFSDEIKIGNHDMKAELASVVYKSVGIVISDVTSVVLQTLELRETNQS